MRRLRAENDSEVVFDGSNSWADLDLLTSRAPIRDGLGNTGKWLAARLASLHAVDRIHCSLGFTIFLSFDMRLPIPCLIFFSMAWEWYD